MRGLRNTGVLGVMTRHRLDGFDDIKEGDIFQAFKVEEIKRTL